MTREVVVACEDAGGAAALAPVIRLIVDRGDHVRYLLGRVALTSLEERALANGVVPLVDEDHVRARVDAPGVFGKDSALLTATSCWGLRIEARAVLSARRARRPSLGVLDFWSSYVARLSFPGASDLAALPDRLAVIDETMRADLVGAGVDDGRLAVTGSPAFDAFRGSDTVRAPEPHSVLFLSQPISALFGSQPGESAFLGYTERSVLADLAAAVHDANGVLTVRPHPREDAGALAAFVASLPCVTRFERGTPLREAVARACLVAGMTTVALIEAALMGAPTLSIQIGRLGDDPLPTNRSGLTVGVTSREELASVLQAALAGTAGPVTARRLDAWPPGASRRVLGELDRLMDAAPVLRSRAP